MRKSGVIARVAAGVAIVVIAAGIAYALLGIGGPSDYIIHARFQNASQLVKGNEVETGGDPIGTVTSIDVTPDNVADVTMSIDPDFAPLHKGVKAIVRQRSLSGEANRYVDLSLPAGGTPALPSGSTLSEQDTTSAVDLDQVFDIFDHRTRKALKGFIRGTATQNAGHSADESLGFLYLNPTLAASSRLFSELTRDAPTLSRFIDETGNLVGDLAQKRADLAGLIQNLSKTTSAIASKSTDLQHAVALLPPFMRRANTTFVNLRTTLNDLRPLVNETKPVAPKLRRFLAELRPLTHEARPALRKLAGLIERPGQGNDLIDLTNSEVPVARIAVRARQRDGKVRQGAFPASTQALQQATPELSSARPYAVDLIGWFDDFSHSGLADALGNASRVQIDVNAFASLNQTLIPLPLGLRQTLLDKFTAAVGKDNNLCPGAAERPYAPDGSNPYVPPGVDCDPSELPPGSSLPPNPSGGNK